MKRPLLFSTLTLVCLLGFSSATQAANRTWNGGGGNDNWGTAANWDAAVAANDGLFFGGAVRLTPNNNFANDTQFNGITFNSGASPFTISGNQIILNGNVTNNDGDLQTINLSGNGLELLNNFQIDAAAGPLAIGAKILNVTGTLKTVTFTGGFNTAVTGNIENGNGPFALTKTGNGTLTLSGANNYTGGTTVSAGTLEISPTGTLAATAPMTVNTGGTLLLKNSVTTGTFQGTGGTVQLSGGSTFTVTQGADVTYAGNITGSGNFVRNGIANGHLRLTGALSYDGSTTVGGTGFTVLVLQSATTNLPATTLLTVNSGGQVDLTGGTPSKTVEIAGLAGNGTIYSFTTMSTLKINLASGTQTFSGIIGSSSPNINLIKDGAGTQILSGANNYTGTTAVNGGKLSLQDTTSNTINGAVSIASGATLAAETAVGANVHSLLGNLTLTGGTLSGNANVSDTARGQFYFNTGGHQVLVSGDVQSTIAAEMHVGGTNTFNVADGAAAEDLLVTGKLSHLHGVVWGGIVKDGAGTMHLASSMDGTNSAGTPGIFGLGGVEMKAGTLIFDGALGYSAFAPGPKAGYYLADFTGNSTLKWGAGNTTDISVNNNMRIGAGITATLDTNGNNVTLGTAIVNGGAGAALTKTGSGTLTLTAANTYTGATTVSQGKLSLQDTASSTINGAVSIASGATLAAETAVGANVHSLLGNLTLTGGTLSGNANVSDTARGQFYFNTGGHQVLVSGDVQSTIAAEMHVGGTNTFNVADGAAAEDLLVTGKLSHLHGVVWGGIVKDGAGTMHLASSMDGTNSAGTPGIFGLGGVEMKAGTLIFDGALGYSAFAPGPKAGYYLADFTGNSTLKWGAGNTTDISVNNNMRIGAGITATLDTNGNNVTLGTAIVPGGAGAALTKIGAGTLTISPANTYTGNTTILQGAVVFSNANAFGTTGSISIGGSTGNVSLLESVAAYMSRNITVNAQTGGTVTIGTLSTFNSGATLHGYSGTVTLNGDVTLQSAPDTIGNRTDFSGIISGTGNVTINDSTGNSYKVIIGDNTNRPALINSWIGSLTVNANSGLQIGAGTTVGNGIPDATNVMVNGTLSIAKNGNEAINALNGSGSISFNAASDGITVGSSGGTGSFSGSINGGGSFTKTGGGTQTLSGASAYTGLTTVSAGTLEISPTGTLAATAPMTVNTGGTLLLKNSVTTGTFQGTGGTVQLSGGSTFTVTQGADVTYAGNITGSGNFVRNGIANGHLRLTGALSYDGSTTVGGTGFTVLVLQSATTNLPATTLLTVNSGGQVDLTGGTPSKTVEIAGLAGNGTIYSFTTMSTLKINLASGTQTFSGIIGSSSPNINLIKDGAGTQILSGANNYTGTTAVNGGKLSLQDTTSNTINGAVSIASGATLAAETAVGANVHSLLGNLTLTGGTLSGNANVSDTARGQFYFNTGGHQVLVSGDVQSTIAAEMHVGGTNTFNVADGAAAEDLLVTGKLSHLHGVVWGGIVKDGAGTMHLASSMDGTNSAGTPGIFGLGGVEMKAGTLIFDGALGYSAFAPGPKAGYYLADFTGNSTLKWGAGNTTDISVNNNMRIGAGITATLDTNGNNVTLGTAIVNGGAGAALTKTGSGTLTLTAANTYTGATTVSQGTLVVGVGGVGSINNSAVTVLFGATLAGSGSSGATTINVGATHKPGNSPGIYTAVGAYILGGDLNLEFAGTGAAGAVNGYSQVHVTATGAGSVALGGSSTLTINYTGGAGNFNPTFAQEFTLIDHDGNTSTDTTGMFSNYNAEGSEVYIDNKTLKIYYHDGGSPDQNNVVLVSTFGSLAGSTLYVNDQWTTPTTVNGDLENGSPAAFVGVNAFDLVSGSPSSLLTTQGSFAGSVVLNGGTYTSAALAGGGGVQLQLVNDTVNGQPDVTIASLTGDSNDSIITQFHNVVGVGDLTVQSGSFAGQISGGGTLTKTSGATLVLDGTNTYSDTTTISGGVLQIGSGSTTGTLGTGNVVNNSALVFNRTNTYAVANAISGTGTVDQIGSGTTLFSGANTNTYTGVTTVSNGTLELARTDGGNKSIAGDGVAATADLVINGGNVLLSASEQIANDARVNLSSGSFMFNGSGLTESIGSFTNTGGVFSTNGANTFIGTGNTITWAGGTNTITSGGLVQDNDWVISGGTNTVQGGPAGTLQVQTGATGLHFSGTATHGVTLNSDAASPGRILLQNNVFVDNAGLTGTAQILSGGSAAVQGTVDMDGGTRTFDVINGTAAVDMLISARLANGALSKTGAGTLQLTGNNTYTGATTVNTGTLELAAPGTLQNGSIAVNAGTFSQSGGTNNVTGVNGNLAIAAGASYQLQGGTLNFGDYATVGSTTWTPADSSTLSMATGSQFSFNGGTLKDVSTITMADNSTFTQNGGDFYVGQINTGPAAETTINGGYSLLSGILNLDVFGDDLTPEQCCDNVASNNDQLTVQGDAYLNGTISLDYVGTYEPEFGDIFTLICADDITLGSGFHIDGGFFRLVPSTGDPNGPMALQAIVPEPASIAVWTLVGLAGAAGAYRSRRRKKGSKY